MNTYEYSGGCHCHDIRFNLKLEKPLESTAITECNCSICEMMGYIHLIISKERFQMLSDWNKLSNYQFNKNIAKHYFCKQCGIKSFYQPRSHPDCWSINVRCLDNYSDLILQINNFDGKNWQKNIGQIT